VVSVSTVDRRRDAVCESAVALVDTHEVVAGPAVDGNARDALAREAEVGRAVSADVDLEDARIAGLQSQRDCVACLAALDSQHTVPQLRALEVSHIAQMGGRVALVGRSSLSLTGRDPGCGGDGGNG